MQNNKPTRNRSIILKLYTIAGSNGSGKTTFAKTFPQFNELYFINVFESVVVESEREIDRMVYELYGLSEEEILIVEGR